MSNPTPPGKPSAVVSGTVLAVVVAVVFCFTVAAVVGLIVAAPQGSDVNTTVTVLLGSLATTIAALVALVKVDSVKQDTHALTNGLMDAKLRAAVAEVLAPHLVDPQARDQIAADVHRRDTYNGGSTT